MPDKILCVDDEPNILAGYKRALHRRFDLDIAVGPKEGLAALMKSSYAVVVADLRMPGMDGVTFLSAVRDRWPDTVRVMLTGEQDIKETIRAVNTANLFRFLSKPCSPDELAKTIDAALQQYALVTAEKELLEKTLSGSVRMLTEVLALASPRAFGRALRARAYVREISDKCGIQNRWQVELATMLSHLGCITLPSDLLDRMVSGQELHNEDLEMVRGHFHTGSNLIKNIPRMEIIARMIALQPSIDDGLIPEDAASEGACILYVALEVEALVTKGAHLRSATAQLRKKVDARCKPYLEILENLDEEASVRPVKAVHVRDLVLGMTLDEDVRTKNGLLLVGKGQDVTDAVISRLRGYARNPGINEPFRVALHEGMHEHG
jgi:response regulator RpfG family c-di-GMP phosphodiesterase